MVIAETKEITVAVVSAMYTINLRPFYGYDDAYGDVAVESKATAISNASGDWRL